MHRRIAMELDSAYTILFCANKRDACLTVQWKLSWESASTRFLLVAIKKGGMLPRFSFFRFSFFSGFNRLISQAQDCYRPSTNPARLRIGCRLATAGSLLRRDQHWMRWYITHQGKTWWMETSLYLYSILFPGRGYGVRLLNNGEILSDFFLWKGMVSRDWARFSRRYVLVWAIARRFQSKLLANFTWCNTFG